MWGGTTRYCAMRHKRIAELQTLIQSSVGLSAVSIDGQPHGSGHSDPTAKQAINLTRLKERYAESIEQLYDDIDDRLSEAHAVENAMCDLDQAELLIIKERYENRRSYMQIAHITRYSEPSVKRIEATAVEKIGARLNVDTF